MLTDEVGGAPKSSVHIENVFGHNSFNARAQRRYLPPDVFKEIQHRVSTHEPIPPELTERFAAGLHRWATERGATHYTHWFIPLTSRSASKHDSFLKRSGDHVISAFSGRTLAQGEPDGSSFPNGGLRATHTARGYTVWDPSSPCFIINHGTGATLYIPCVFISWKGHALDEKTPLLRSGQALNREGLKLLRAMGDTSHEFVRTDSGLEQEFFLIDKDYYLKRPDLVQTGRTLVGATPPKGQELSDQYFTDLTERTMKLIDQVEVELWKLGIPQTTRHKEVAPGQYEIAPVFSSMVVASDQNVLTLEVLQRVAHSHGMEALVHEKPFAHLNGSGKHNNWSIGTDRIGTLFEPGPKPSENLLFMMFVAATLRGVDVYQDLVRAAVATSSNDHRLGGHEAPPAIIAVYMGADMTEQLEKFVNKDSSASSHKPNKDLGFSCLPEFRPDTTDRNRTSPFAFTGNKFEFRAVGAGMHPHRSNYILNSIAADSCRAMAEEIESRLAGRKGKTDRQDVAAEVARDWIRKHRRICFDGDCYSKEWHEEAARRGLLNRKTTPECLVAWTEDKNVKMFDSLRVFSPEESRSRFNIHADDYSTKLRIEALSLTSILNTAVLPAAYELQTRVAGAAAAVVAAGGKVPKEQSARLEMIGKHIAGCLQVADKLAEAADKLSSMDGELARAVFARDTIKPLMAEGREYSDALENMCDAKEWRLPTYHEMLFTGQVYDVAPTSD